MPAPTYDQVNKDYNAYLGRSASQDEYNSYWANKQDYNSGDISNSAEGLAWTNKQIPGQPGYDPTAGVFSGNDTGQGKKAPAPPPGRMDDTYISGIVNQWMTSNNPVGNQDASYWVRRIKETGGLGDDNMDYWLGRFTNRPGLHGPENGPADQTTPTSVPGAPAPASIPTYQDPRMAALYSQLLARSQQSLNVTPDDPIIKAQSDAYGVTADRQALQDRETAAERGGQYATGALDNNSRMITENVASQKGQFVAAAMQREVDARRGEIKDALSGMYGVLSSDQAAALRAEDQSLLARQQDLTAQQNGFTNGLNSRIQTQNELQAAWQRQFQDRGYQTDLDQQNWENDYKTKYGN